MRIWICAGIFIIFILVTFTNGRSSSNDDDGEVDYPKSEGDGEQTVQVRETVDDDSSSFTAVDESLARREFFDFNNLFQRRQSSGFTASQRKFQELMLKAHNQYRARHCVSLLVSDDGLQRSAQNYAEYMAKINRMVHSQTNGVGENLFMKWSSAPMTSISGTEASDAWYNEIKLYNYNSPGFSMSTGHFTQVVWKGSKKVGFGFALTSDGNTLYIAAQYSPPGNYMGQFAQNVLQAKC